MLASTPRNSSANHRQAEPGGSEYDTPRLLVILALVLERLVGRNDPLVASRDAANGPGSAGSVHVLGKNMKVFDGVRAPSISIPKYLQRIYKYTNCAPSCFAVAYVYIDRLVHRHPELLVVSLNVHRLLITSVMVASKMFDDEHYDNAFYARVGGVSNAEINRLELEMLFLLDFDVIVKASEFEIYCLSLEKEMSRLCVDGVTLASSVLDRQSMFIGNEGEEDDMHEIAVQLA